MITIELDGLAWAVRDLGSGRPLLLLHGFTGSGSSWSGHVSELARTRRTIAPDLPGHGASGTSAPDRMTVERTADDLTALLTRLDARPADVLGYSLGARIALRLTVAHPDAVGRLVLESPSAGIEGPDERAARRAADERLADRIERDGIETFVDAWERNPVFASQPAVPTGTAARVRAIRLANTPAGLAASLRGAGQGAMEPVQDRLANVTARTIVITGALDDIGRPRAERVAAGIPGARLAVIEGAGHTPHDEQPATFRRLVLDFLQEVPAA
jgi:2-succinyl-6-hydroxy-2,4-cyclohexadiene-1-carboxylate synthase